MFHVSAILKIYFCFLSILLLLPLPVNGVSLKAQCHRLVNRSVPRIYIVENSGEVPTYETLYAALMQAEQAKWESLSNNSMLYLRRYMDDDLSGRVSDWRKILIECSQRDYKAYNRLLYIAFEYFYIYSVRGEDEARLIMKKHGAITSYLLSFIDSNAMITVFAINIFSEFNPPDDLIASIGVLNSRKCRHIDQFLSKMKAIVGYSRSWNE